MAGDGGGVMRSIVDAMKTSFSELNSLVQNNVDGNRVAMPLRALDYMLSIGPGTVLVVAGRPGVGKTSLALGIAAEAARCSQHVLIVSPCAREQEVASRIVCAAGQVDIGMLHRGLLRPDDWNRLAETARSVGELEAYIRVDDAPFVTAQSLAATVERFVAQRPRGLRPHLLVLDYVQLVRAEPRRQNRYEELCDVSFELKCIARRFDVAVVAVSQLNRNIDDRGRGALPRLTDLRDSGTLEDEATAVVLIHEDNSGEDDSERRRIIVAKNNLGPVGTFSALLRRGAWFDAPHEEHLNDRASLDATK
jgi:replicative DNA helicase